ncbi:hypothetical protein Mal48_42680 [Thalassoglobus polymorphus]|uniref:Uncharacterized protein n=1 Tax=Thalassoglobus polymorphus TaxID=2527994 RepID=A0A517QTM0_9PLAN|nr:hypothetical protein Mal48_42680 [Thalassoglobus polymorphus]
MSPACTTRDLEGRDQVCCRANPISAFYVLQTNSKDALAIANDSNDPAHCVDGTAGALLQWQLQRT